MSKWEKTARELGAATVASTAAPLSLNWTDVIKIRMQTPPTPGCTSLPYIGGFAATSSRILREEGLFRLWSYGMPASLLREALCVGIRIGGYPAVRDAVSAITKGQGGGESGVGSKLFAGIVLGAISGILASPCDLVRIRIQAEAGLCDVNGMMITGLRAGHRRNLQGTVDAFSVAFEGGVQGLFRGAYVNVLRSCLSSCGTVPVYEHTKHLAKTRFDVPDTPVLHLGAGVVAGLTGTTCTAPADVMRTRIMTSKDGLGFFGAARNIMSEQGLRGFFRGWVPAYLRIGPIFVGMPALVEQVRVRFFGLGYIV